MEGFRFAQVQEGFTVRRLPDMDASMKVWWETMESALRFSTILMFFGLVLSVVTLAVWVWLMHRMVRIGERLADQTERLVTRYTVSPTPSSDELRAAAARRVAELEAKK